MLLSFVATSLTWPEYPPTHQVFPCSLTSVRHWQHLLPHSHQIAYQFGAVTSTRWPARALHPHAAITPLVPLCDMHGRGLGTAVGNGKKNKTNTRHRKKHSYKDILTLNHLCSFFTYLCMYVYMHVWMYISICSWMCICICIHTRMRKRINKHIHI